jgi:molybdopterin synthase catalytic subunit
MSVCVQTQPIDVARETEALRAAASGAGALVSFLGLVRDLPGESLTELFLEHYPGMTEKALELLEQEACQRWSLEGVRLVHRYGALQPSEAIVWVAVASLHRQEAFSACEFLMDALKSRVPFWKKEITRRSSAWVEHRASDQRALKRWTQKS